MQEQSSVTVSGGIQGSATPPILLGFCPSGDEIVAQIIPAYQADARRRLAWFPYFVRQGDDYCVHVRRGNDVMLSDQKARRVVSEIGRGQFLELANLCEFLFKGNKESSAKPSLTIETTDGKHTFDSFELCDNYLSDLAGQWEDWGKEGST